MYFTSDQELATRHVAEGETRLDKLRELIMRMESNGHPSDGAKQLLDTFECILEQMRLHREFIEAQLLRKK